MAVHVRHKDRKTGALLLTPIERAAPRLLIIDALRGIAALSVAWFHLSHVMGLVPVGPTILYHSGTWGWIGVEVFFVISGFVIPWALDRAKYSLHEYPRFLVKRIVRLDPPYLLSVLAYIILAAYFAHATHTKFPYTAVQMLLHLGYLNVFFGYLWVNPVYWTLAIEIQYYVLVGLAFPLIKKPLWCWLFIAPVVLELGILMPSLKFIFRFAPYFLMGIAAFHHRRGSISKAWFLLIVPVLGYLGGTGPLSLAWVTGTVCVIACMAIAFVDRPPPKPLLALGSISYSLYLMHGPVGYTVASIIVRRLPWVPAWIEMIVAIIASVVAAWVLYRFVELPSQRLSSRIRYRSVTARA